VKQAIREAPEKLFGCVDVYEFGDGAMVLSGRGAVRGLTGEAKGATNYGMIERYASRILAETGATNIELVEFLTPDKTRARGIWLHDYKRVVRAYADGFIAGTLHKNQEHIGRNCAAMQAAAADLGWDALARAMFGESLPPANVPVVFNQYLRDHATSWEPFYDWELPQLLKRMIRLPVGSSRELGPSYPVWMKGIHQFIYDCALGQLADAARNRRDALGADTIPQVLTDEVKRSLRSHWGAILGAAREAIDLAQFKRLVASIFRTTVRAVEDSQARRRLEDVPEQGDLFKNPDAAE
jgi:hypothetical protein